MSHKNILTISCNFPVEITANIFTLIYLYIEIEISNFPLYFHGINFAENEINLQTNGLVQDCDLHIAVELEMHSLSSSHVFFPSKPCISSCHQLFFIFHFPTSTLLLIFS